MRVSFIDRVVQRDIYDIEAVVTLDRIQWELLPNTECIEDDDFDIFAETQEASGRRAAEVQAEERVRDNVFRMMDTLLRRMERSRASAISSQALEGIVSGIQEKVSLREGVRVLARNIGKPRLKKVASLCSSDKGHQFYRDLTLEEIMIVGCLEDPEKAYDVSSDESYRKAWRVYFNLNTLECGVVYYFSKSGAFPGFRSKAMHTLRVPFKGEIQEEFKKVGMAVNRSSISYRDYIEGKFNRFFTYITTGALADPAGSMILKGKRVTRARCKKKRIFFGNDLGKMLWFDDYTRLVTYLESVPKVLLNNTEFNGYCFFFDDHLLIYDENGRLVEKIKTKRSFNADFVKKPERRGNGRDELADYRQEVAQESATLEPLVRFIRHVEEEASAARAKGELTPRDMWVGKIREDLGIDLGDSFRRPETQGLRRNYMVHFDPPLGYRFPEMYRAFHMILSHVPQNLRRFVRNLMDDRVVDYLFSVFEAEELDPSQREKGQEPKSYYIEPMTEPYWPARKASDVWESRLRDSRGWFGDRYDDFLFRQFMVVDVRTLWAIFQKSDRERYLQSILANLFEKIWPYHITHSAKRRYLQALLKYPERYSDLVSTLLVINQTTSSRWERDEEMLLGAGHRNEHASGFGNLLALYVLDPGKSDSYPDIKEYFDWLCGQDFSPSSTGEDSND